MMFFKTSQGKTFFNFSHFNLETIKQETVNYYIVDP